MDEVNPKMLESIGFAEKPAEDISIVIERGVYIDIPHDLIDRARTYPAIDWNRILKRAVEIEDSMKESAAACQLEYSERQGQPDPDVVADLRLAELERAVIEAAIKFTELGGYHDDLSENVAAQGDLTDAVDALLKARGSK